MSDKGENAVVGVVGVNPLETLPIEIDLMQSGLRREQFVQVADQALHAMMRIMLQKVPIKTARFAPLTALRQLLAHEQKFFPRMGALIRKKEPQIRELLPQIARHFVQE